MNIDPFEGIREFKKGYRYNAELGLLNCKPGTLLYSINHQILTNFLGIETYSLTINEKTVRVKNPRKFLKQIHSFKMKTRIFAIGTETPKQTQDDLYVACHIKDTDKDFYILDYRDKPLLNPPNYLAMGIISPPEDDLAFLMDGRINFKIINYHKLEITENETYFHDTLTDNWHPTACIHPSLGGKIQGRDNGSDYLGGFIRAENVIAQNL